MIYFNIGNPQQLGQPPLTYVREILSLLNYPQLIVSKEKLVELGYHMDSIMRAQKIMKLNPVGLGAYSQSAGMPFIRQAVADFIAARDGIPADPKTIFITDGASKGVDLVLSSIIEQNTGIMIPIPQYPLYSADITLFGGKQVKYYLDEENDWALSRELLEESYTTAVENGIDVKLIVVINPNNPTGSVLDRENIKMMLEFASEKNLMVIADEVYQENIYDQSKAFFSFARVAHEESLEIPLFSLHSTSKGFIGECGYRGGYIESRNVPDDVLSQLLKVRSIGLCANTSGQIVTYLMVTPPKEGEESYELYQRERKAILDGMAKKARIISEVLNSIDGISCPTPKGAMYLFPKISFPDKDYGGKNPDFLFAKHLVETAGIVTVPGSGFGQLPGTWHLRITFLPPEEKIESIMSKFKDAYLEFIK
ncbi:MAG: aminotransferase class I/II-fold pyridoxal phosphate-dependent enzyme [Candidatus Heimdallarchaeota archaeon]|nr:aminotransferase class I/II-fold pyridoxal phosphate-dependent enzyme [Candidatus Heimdallarchaeota archaeon]